MKIFINVILAGIASLLFSSRIQAQACSDPAWVDINDITPTHVYASCAPVAGALAYEFTYSTETGASTVITSSLPNATFSVLPGEEHHMMVRTVCTPTERSPGIEIVITEIVIYERIEIDLGCTSYVSRDERLNNVDYSINSKQPIIKLATIDKCCICKELKRLRMANMIFSDGKEYTKGANLIKNAFDLCKTNMEFDPCDTKRINNFTNANRISNPNKQSIYKVQLYMINGELIWESANEQVTSDEALQNKIKEVLGLHSGIYIIKLDNADENRSIKFFVE